MLRLSNSPATVYSLTTAGIRSRFRLKGFKIKLKRSLVEKYLFLFLKSRTSNTDNFFGVNEYLFHSRA